MNAAADLASTAAGTGANGSSTPAGLVHGEALALPSIGAAERTDAQPILALGAWFKHAACLLEDGRARFGPNLGDLDNAEACRGVAPAVAALLAASGRPPRAVAHDLHPDFHSTRVALATAARLGLPAFGVQHHHAHAGAVLAEHGRFDTRPVLALALDGVGLGSDGGAWGGELLWVSGAQFVRLGHLRPLRLPGGDRAAREPWRMAAALLHASGRGAEIARRFARQPAAAQLAQVLARPALCPPTTSLGRHFDAAAGLLGICEVMEAEAEAALALEALAAHSAAPEVTPGDWRILAHPATPAPTADGTGRSAVGAGAAASSPPAAPLLELDLHPLLLRLADETDAARGAARFQATVAAALVDWVEHARTPSGCDTIVLCGGCLHNRLLSAALESALGAHGLTVLGAQRLSPGDAGLALGQAWVAHHRLAAQES
ncbi:hydrogenase maturation protein HypF [Thauera chlorobenzoica]|uniref:[NiFe] hydrogenase metallocenter assembly protein HypF n=1 Tax=Thauera chlorobenzoica TaxID=96773 RepID=A0A1H5SY31_9RHOO|nr:hydrogenase maturation protein HypF [Thauera chlorobenzoica]APR04049.1 [NiFe] hydrogenase metallocenter assembly protein HypF [Thauera chlorobenzoica]SEF54761.1 hydrogenase maturation protein HypF [Thauera chlorobenzoica]